MKTRFIAVLAAAALSQAPAATAQTFGQFTGAEPVAPGSHLAGVYLQTSENVLGLLGQLRMSFYPGVDFGFQGGLARQDYGTSEVTTVRLGADLKYAAMTPVEGYPYALAVGGALGIESGDDFNILRVGPTIVGSRSLRPGDTVALTPYVGMALLFSNLNVGEEDDTDFSFPLRAGATLRLQPGFEIGAEVNLRLGDDFDDNAAFSFGAQFPF